ncbi:MAG TPA: phospholipid carrier-dependent glycosyltransferase [Cyanobacteria bacterium UBA11149]|nr:phospholipid carrier-dependent glycosyltransferase [Cyanobacteria bacterium UBA11367]HBE57914.1 phospholipid carrier-dependent glycosyltransferase [Cyanobacteria bacterium UBA11366]HBK66460.1 phospholipid carrier-dependent glycosyltransferase [Cyanobacteria bacterium UBA11166]HBR74831.1 phospholipid carrier-dependent glycosyltransferase [Cyanobacteria bacterium UBA11159]HBS69086.1 phospholipid carrier-dependent glycosyltransferase [Cyanobacteria bacterium UBA11153]HBW90939.1 phospholipid ca
MIFIHKHWQNLLILGIIWVITTICDRVWFGLDNSVPSWDRADYLTGSLNYLRKLQNPQWFAEEWWTSLWHLSSKIPPLTYIATAIIQNFFGKGPDKATLILPVCTAILMASVYGLGTLLFNRKVGLWAGGLIILLPGLYRYRLEFLLDYPLTTVVTLTFFCLTAWKIANQKPNPPHSKKNTPYCLIWTIGFGISLGLALMVKQTALLFLILPIIWVIAGSIKERNWRKLSQLLISLLISGLICTPWYSINWLFILTSGKRATLDSAIAEGDPPLNTIDAWIYYWKILPYLVSWVLLIVPIVGFILYWQKSKSLTGEITNSNLRKRELFFFQLSSFRWLAVFLIGGYLLSSLNVNKDARYILPILPVLSLLLANGLLQWQGRWSKNIRWSTVGLSILLMICNIFPVGGTILTEILSPRVQNFPYLGTELPHREVIAEIIQTSPYLQTTLGVLPSTGEINQHNLNYYGALQDFQVYGRQVGIREKQIKQDAQSLSWFLIKTGNQGSVPAAQTAMVKEVETNRDFQVQKTWKLPDNSLLKLYHRRQPFIEIAKQESIAKNETSQIKLEMITIPETAPPGIPIPITYQWSGTWDELQSGILLLTWQNIVIKSHPKWLNDRAIAMGELYPSQRLTSGDSQFTITETTSTLPPADIPEGNYTLTATYLNRNTGETYPIEVPKITLKIDSNAPAIPAPELDLVTQLTNLATNLPKGPKFLPPVFAETGRINQYDPTQDYLIQADIALSHRLKLEPDNLEVAYTLTLSKILQKDPEGAIAILQKIIKLDAQNPYPYAYLAFVYLYQWQGKEAENSLNQAQTINPNLPEIKALSSIAALMQGKIFQAWHFFDEFRKLEMTYKSPQLWSYRK